MTFKFWLSNYDLSNNGDEPFEIVDADDLESATVIAAERLYDNYLIGSKADLISHCADDDAWNIVSVAHEFKMVARVASTKGALLADSQ